MRLCEVEAPPFKETKRGVLFAQMLREAGLTNIRTDSVGNVLGERPGAAAAAAPGRSRPISTRSFPRARTSW